MAATMMTAPAAMTMAMSVTMSTSDLDHGFILHRKRGDAEPRRGGIGHHQGRGYEGSGNQC
jgi:hypothetical protein